MKSFFHILYICILINFSTYSQVSVALPDSILLNEINKLHKSTIPHSFSPVEIIDSLRFEKLKILERKLDPLLARANYINLLNKYILGKYYLQNGQKEKAIILFKEIMRFEFWGKYRNEFLYYVNGGKSGSYFSAFFELYWKSGRLLIESYKGNLEELNKLQFVPSSYPNLNSYLYSAIIRAGGKWSKTKGPVNFPIPRALRQAIKKEREKYEK